VDHTRARSLLIRPSWTSRELVAYYYVLRGPHTSSLLLRPSWTTHELVAYYSALTAVSLVSCVQSGTAHLPFFVAVRPMRAAVRAAVPRLRRASANCVSGCVDLYGALSLLTPMRWTHQHGANTVVTTRRPEQPVCAARWIPRIKSAREFQTGGPIYKISYDSLTIILR